MLGHHRSRACREEKAQGGEDEGGVSHNKLRRLDPRVEGGGSRRESTCGASRLTASWRCSPALPLNTQGPHLWGTSFLTVELVTWEYGEVAQILHVGGYDEETADTEALKEFIRSQGYEITGLHEEEYLKGPGFLFAGNPDKYLTLIRYPVKKIDPSSTP